jgi:hypothetical protein
LGTKIGFFQVYERGVVMKFESKYMVRVLDYLNTNLPYSGEGLSISEITTGINEQDNDKVKFYLLLLLDNNYIRTNIRDNNINFAASSSFKVVRLTLNGLLFYHEFKLNPNHILYSLG